MKLITTMTLKELEKEHTKEAQILLNMLSCNKYTKQDIEKQKNGCGYYLQNDK